jgi:hypothetical protein
VAGFIPAPDPSKILAVHAALRPTGHILYFSGSDYTAANFNRETPVGTDHTCIFDPATGMVRSVNSPVPDLFCCGHAMTHDGHLVVAGGTAHYPSQLGHHHTHWPGLRDTWVFTGEEWHAQQPMNLEPGTGPSPEPAVTVVSRDPEHLDLFWVDPFDGRIMSCFFGPLPGGASAWNGANAQSRSFGLTAARAAPLDASVAAVSTDPQSIDVFWISAGGHVKQLQWRGTWNVSDPPNRIGGRTVTVEVSPNSHPLTRRSSSTLPKVWAGWAARKASRSNSRLVRASRRLRYRAERPPDRPADRQLGHDG